MATFEGRFFGALLKKDPTAASAMLAEESAVLMSESSYMLALQIAAQNGYATLVTALLLHMTDKSINATDIVGQTVLHTASEFRQSNIVEILLSRMSAEAINAATDSPCRSTALHLASSNGDEKTVAMLLKVMSPAAIDAVDGAGWTSLMHAANQGNAEIIKMLLPKMSRAAIDAGRKSYITVLYLADISSERHIKIAEPRLEKNDTSRDQSGGHRLSKIFLTIRGWWS